MKYTFESDGELVVLDHLPNQQVVFTPHGAFKQNPTVFDHWKRTKGIVNSMPFGDNARLLFGSKLDKRDLGMPLGKSIRRNFNAQQVRLYPRLAEVFRTESGEITAMPYQYIVCFRKEKSSFLLGTKQKFNQLFFLETLDPIWEEQNCYVVTAKGQTLPSFFEGLRTLQGYQEDIVYAHPNFIGKLVLDTSDQLFNQQWAVNPSALVGGRSPHATVDIIGAWNKIQNQNISLTPTRVMVLDQGIFQHVDLQFSSLSNSNTSLSHGIKVAGVLGALQNSIGISGISPRVNQTQNTAFTLVGQNFPTQFDTIATEQMAIDQATWVRDFLRTVLNATPKPKVLNLSFNFLGYPRTRVLKEILTELSKSMLICVSAGNFKPGGQTGSESVLGYPAYLPNIVLPVGAIDMDGKRVTTSNGHSWASKYGFPGGNGIMAPGVQILTTDKGGTYPFFNGTSAAAPFVSGIAALLFAARSNVTPADIRKVLLDSASISALSPLQNTSSNFVGKGLVQANAALTLLLTRFP